MAFNCGNCSGFQTGGSEGYTACCNGTPILMHDQSNCGSCREDAQLSCDAMGAGGHSSQSGGCDSGSSVAPKKPRLTSGISRMRSATGFHNQIGGGKAVKVIRDILFPPPTIACSCGCLGTITNNYMDCSCCDDMGADTGGGNTNRMRSASGAYRGQAGFHKFKFGRPSYPQQTLCYCDGGASTTLLGEAANCVEACGNAGVANPNTNKTRMRSVTGEAGAVSNDTIRKYAQFALVISLVALSVNIYSMRKNK